jgi:hypothetical protein
MSRSSIRNQLFINDGLGNKLPIQTGTWVSSAINIDEHRRLSFTIGIGSATGAVGDAGGFTGILQVQGTDEIAQSNGCTGTPEAGNTSRPGTNGFTGALYWQPIQSGTVAINNTMNRLQLSFSDVGVGFVRLAFNTTATGILGAAAAGGSGTWNVFMTAKNT